MAKKEKEPKVILERSYIIPLRRQWLKVPEYKRATKAVKAIKQFLAKHMKVYDRDLRKIRVDVLLNNEIRFRGMRKPPTKIKVKVKKYDNDIVRAELAEIPQVIKYKLEREKRRKLKAEKKDEKKEEKVEEKKEELEKKLEEEKKEETKEEKEEKEEKKKAVKEAGFKESKFEAKRAKHIVEGKKQLRIRRLAAQE